MQLFRRKDVSAILAEGGDGHESGGASLSKSLTVRDLTALGIAAVVGAGIFSTIGNAAAAGGPAVSLLFVFTAVACGFSALCYAEFASALPISGSAYTYAYASFGEIIAWMLGWSLLMEYAIGNIAVAISWSGYFTALLDGFGWHVPDYLTMDYLSASRGYDEVSKALAGGAQLSSLKPALQEAYAAWVNAPQLGSLRIIADIPALLIVVAITWLVFIGIKESKNAGNVMVAIKLAVVLGVIILGAFFINLDNWSPFAPNGFAGVMSGVSAVFFAYIGFDAISTTAEECKNPQRDLPRAMIYALIICTLLYVLVALVLTGIAPYQTLGVDDPLAFVFSNINIDPSIRRIIIVVIAVSAVVAMSSVLLVFQMGQPRIWMAMSRDGLLPPIFGRIHHKYHTPWFSTLVTGFIVAIPSLFMNLTEVTDLTSIGTLFAFVLVCGGVLKMQQDPKGGMPSKFRVPYVNGGIWLPLGYVVTIVLVWFKAPDLIRNLWSYAPDKSAISEFWARFPRYLFIIVATWITIQAVRRRYSLIPVLGMLSCLYLMTEMSVLNWERFFGWLLLGIIVYFVYGYRNSRLAKKAAEAAGKQS